MHVVTGVRDRVADRFLGLEVHRNPEVAVRSFTNALAMVANDPANLLNTNTEDFELVLLGYFDSQCGYIYYEDPDYDYSIPTVLISGKTAVELKKQMLSLSELKEHPAVMDSLDMEDDN